MKTDKDMILEVMAKLGVTKFGITETAGGQKSLNLDYPPNCKHTNIMPVVMRSIPWQKLDAGKYQRHGNDWKGPE